MAILKPGTRLLGANSTTEMIVIAAPDDEVEIAIGGVPAVNDDGDRDLEGAPVDGHEGGALLGKRYTDGAGTVELLCTKAGDGTPALDGEMLRVKEAKPLPASD